jgi:hypothetical protein
MCWDIFVTMVSLPPPDKMLAIDQQGEFAVEADMAVRELFTR